MAHSGQRFRGRYEIFNDLDLIVLFLFLQDEFKETTEGAETNPLAAWEQSLCGYGPGVIRLELDAMAADANGVQRLAVALGNVRRRIFSFGESVPCGLLNSKNFIPGIRFCNYPVEDLVDAAVRLERLISS